MHLMNQMTSPITLPPNIPTIINFYLLSLHIQSLPHHSSHYASLLPSISSLHWIKIILPTPSHMILLSQSRALSMRFLGAPGLLAVSCRLHYATSKLHIPKSQSSLNRKKLVFNWRHSMTELPWPPKWSFKQNLITTQPGTPS